VKRASEAGKTYQQVVTSHKILEVMFGDSAHSFNALLRATDFPPCPFSNCCDVSLGKTDWRDQRQTDDLERTSAVTLLLADLNSHCGDKQTSVLVL